MKVGAEWSLDPGGGGVKTADGGQNLSVESPILRDGKVGGWSIVGLKERMTEAQWHLKNSVCSLNISITSLNIPARKCKLYQLWWSWVQSDNTLIKCIVQDEQKNMKDNVFPLIFKICIVSG